ncbi:hypothetical protein QN372_00870 [Undibacterium sp. RTI2.1]|uniref:hypothetical protein n=1 Tax=unclassified Undibacterium TaxID=2630295 RepID=UPI002AB464F7|nr:MULTISPECIES: hypothetical protein [unclassified Undibacterium]MDY7537689.1 hypothetical protein [Undibacterium sp. 5I1]MEB0029291.1 hypothetical protein [Undibacterium sp. RTI2.1]MEB0115599.1 hypothetical protein [Undibacterium sp. RTI2.2]MEB0256426.1 hypothetical protein [Undibacterium sp. 5I1]
MPIDREAEKEAIKEALQEWLDKQFAIFGKWTIAGLVALAFAGLVYIALIGQGWHK